MKKGFLFLAVAVLMAGGPFVHSAAAATFTCTETVFGPSSIQKSVTVPSGSTCNLQGIRVRGNVTVQPGGRLIIGGTSRVDGFVSARSAGSDTTTDPFGTGQTFSVVVCNTRIGSYVDIKGSIDRVIVGGGPCGGNSINGDVKLRQNTGGVVLVGNAPQAESGACTIEQPKPPDGFGLGVPCGIGGEVQVLDNSGSINPPYDETESAAVGYNNIDEDLICTGNANGVTDITESSDSNIVGGDKVDQCAVL